MVFEKEVILKLTNKKPVAALSLEPKVEAFNKWLYTDTGLSSRFNFAMNIYIKQEKKPPKSFKVKITFIDEKDIWVEDNSDDPKNKRCLQ